MFEKPLQDQQQWELVAGLAGRFVNLSKIRHEAAVAERDAKRLRRLEAKVLQEVQAYRKHLGLPDIAIPDESVQAAHQVQGARYG